MEARLWLFVPTYNEVGNLEAVVRATVPGSRTPHRGTGGC